MSYLWDYPKNRLKKSVSGKLLILERLINFGSAPSKEKVKLAEVKKNWKTLRLQPRKKRLFELLIWGK